MIAGHKITATTHLGIARGGINVTFTKAVCSCNEWEESFESLNETRRAEVRASARAHLDAHKTTVPAP